MTGRHTFIVSADQNSALLLPEGRRAVAVENVGGCCFKSPSGNYYARCALFDACGSFLAYCLADARKDGRNVCWKPAEENS